MSAIHRNLGHGSRRTGRGTCSLSGISLVSWDQEFFDPIILPGGKPLLALCDAAHYIIKLPKAERDAEDWEAAMQALLLVAEQDRPTMLARIGSSFEPPRRTCVRPIMERQALEEAEIKEGSMTSPT